MGLVCGYQRQDELMGKEEGGVEICSWETGELVTMVPLVICPRRRRCYVEKSVASLAGDDSN